MRGLIKARRYASVECIKQPRSKNVYYVYIIITWILNAVLNKFRKWLNKEAFRDRDHDCGLQKKFDRRYTSDSESGSSDVTRHWYTVTRARHSVRRSVRSVLRLLFKGKFCLAIQSKFVRQISILGCLEQTHVTRHKVHVQKRANHTASARLRYSLNVMSLACNKLITKPRLAFLTTLNKVSLILSLNLWASEQNYTVVSWPCT